MDTRGLRLPAPRSALDARWHPWRVLGLIALLLAAAMAFCAEASAGEQRFVRMGLNKSIVVRLPAAARDVLVGNPAVVDAAVRTQRTAYLFAKGVGQTNAFFFDADGRQILSLDIEVALDSEALMNLIRRTIPGTRITVDTVNDSVVLGGIAANPGEAKLAFDLASKFTGDEKKVLSTIAVTGKEQVMLRVRIAEVQRDVLKQFGINAQAIIEAGNVTFNPLRMVNPFTLSPSGPLVQDSFYAMNYADGGNTIDVVLRAMERDGLFRTLAEPTLTAISGESAKFLAGGEFPVPVADNDNSITVVFKPFGVGLGFTPVVMSEGRISLRISTEVSEISSENSIVIAEGGSSLAIPGLQVRRAETTLELPSGGSLVLAGLIKEETKQQINGVPALKNLPILGTLFRSRDFQARQTELLIMVTPYVANPVNDKQLASPLDRLNIATDRQTILWGRLNKVYGAAGDTPKGVYHGNVGFIVE